MDIILKSYKEVKDKHAPMIECFFAFSNEQLAEGKIKAKIGDKPICAAGQGLFGTREGIKQFMDFYDNQTAEIGKECDPQEVYNYEFSNHECDYTYDDTEAFEIVLLYFGEERAKEVKRKKGYSHL